MNPKLMRDLAKCLIHKEDSADHEALVEIVEKLSDFHPPPEATALVAEGLARAYRIGKADAA